MPHLPSATTVRPAIRTAALAAVLAATLAAPAALLAVAPASAGPTVPATELRPGALPRGANVAIPHVVTGATHDTLVDGDLRIALPGRSTTLLGRSGAAYVVKVFGDRERVLRVRRDGTLKTFIRGIDVENVTLSRDGGMLAAGTILSTTRSRVTLYDARTGEQLRRRVFAGQRNVLDASATRVLVGGFRPKRTEVWRLADDSVRTLRRGVGYRADLAVDRLASYTKDPYLGGCTVVTSISAPQTVLWRSCAERVESFSPTGARMATIPKLTDGIGAVEVQVRRVRGHETARYTTAGWFGLLAWEDGRHLLLDTTGRKQVATVRCDVATGALADCERASALRPRVEP